MKLSFYKAVIWFSFCFLIITPATFGQWQQLTDPPVIDMQEDLAASLRSVGDAIILETYLGKIYFSVDLGDTWELILDSSESDLYYDFVYDNDHLWIIREDAILKAELDEGILQSIDTVHTYEGYGAFVGIHQDTLWAIFGQSFLTAKSLYYSIDEGKEWIKGLYENIDVDRHFNMKEGIAIVDRQLIQLPGTSTILPRADLYFKDPAPRMISFSPGEFFDIDEVHEVNGSLVLKTRVYDTIDFVSFQIQTWISEDYGSTWKEIQQFNDVLQLQLLGDGRFMCAQMVEDIFNPFKQYYVSTDADSWEDLILADIPEGLNNTSSWLIVNEGYLFVDWGDHIWRHPLDATTAVENNHANGLASASVFPNPFQNRIVIEKNTNDLSDFTFTVYSPGGKIVWSSKVQFTSSQLEINLDDVSPGAYYGTLQRLDGRILWSGNLIKAE